MANNIFNYIEKYGYTKVLDKEYNDVDYVVFSQLSYLDFDGIVKTDFINLNDCLKQFLKDLNYKEFLKKGLDQKNLYRLVLTMIDKDRYKDILIGNYIYKITNDEMFCAFTLKLDDGSKYVCYEGTDNNISGWEENFNLCYQYPVASQIDAINYLNRSVSLFDKKVIVGGHSKGGNMALVAAMNANIIAKMKVVKVYNLDGPGLLKAQIESKKYQRIVHKLEHIVPNYSLIGLLLRHGDNYRVVKASRKDIFAHSPFYWEVEKDHFIETQLSKLSTNLDNSITLWLDNHTLVERAKICRAIFKLLKDVGIKTLLETTKLKNIIAIVKKSKDVDAESKELFLNFIKFNIIYCLENRELEHEKTD